MKIQTFQVIGENIHCTRSYKTDGKLVESGSGGRYAIRYEDAGGASRRLPVPDAVVEGADWKSGKVRHAAVAVWQGLYGCEEARACGRDYLHSLALRQQRAGAAWLDVNVDEFSTDTDERCRAMGWLVELLNPVVGIPLSVDSSNTDVLRSGLRKCLRAHGSPIINSVSLERADAIALAVEYGAAVIASAAGENDLPSDVAGRIANLDALMAELKSAGLDDKNIHIDPLVFPVATDATNARLFLEATRAVREKYGPRIHLVGGFSNVSFGMPCRKLLNLVFTRLAVEAGADGGIVDPLQINLDALNGLDTGTEAFGLARALLMGEDDFGIEFISAHREGRLAQ